jgi:hypothetical protein
MLKEYRSLRTVKACKIKDIYFHSLERLAYATITPVEGESFKTKTRFTTYGWTLNDPGYYAIDSDVNEFWSSSADFEKYYRQTDEICAEGYRFVEPGETLSAGDEVRCRDNTWIEVQKSAFGTTCEPGYNIVRRPLEEPDPNLAEMTPLEKLVYKTMQLSPNYPFTHYELAEDIGGSVKKFDRVVRRILRNFADSGIVDETNDELYMVTGPQPPAVEEPNEKPPTESHQQYRDLKSGCVLQDGDQYFSHGHSEWISCDTIGMIGIAIPPGSLTHYRRPVSKDTEASYRDLEPGEMVEPGDEYYIKQTDSWSPCAWLDNWSPTRTQSKSDKYRRPVKAKTEDAVKCETMTENGKVYRMLGKDESVQKGDQFRTPIGWVSANNWQGGNGKQGVGCTYRRPLEPAPAQVTALFGAMGLNVVGVDRASGKDWTSLVIVNG